MIEKKTITKALVALVCLAAVFLTGLFFGRTGSGGDFTVTTQYAVGAMSAQELDDIADRVDARATRETEEQVPTQQTNHQGAETPADSGLVNINTADSTALQTLPGVGPAIAERIIAHRETHGAFRIIEEITDVSGIGERRFEDIRDLITVE